MLKKESDSIGVIGVTQFAVGELGDIVFLELPEVGSEVTRDGQMGEVESVKAAADVHMPVNGTVIAANSDLEDEPEKVNSDPYGEAWFIKISPLDFTEIESLMDADAYARHCTARNE